MVAVHGEIVDEAGYNAGFGTFGPGNRANATTGRAMRLILLHIGGGRPGDGDASTQGQPAKYTYCFAENAPASPWPIYPHCRGVDAPSAVTVAGVEGPHNSHDMWSTHPGPIFSKMASVMTTLGSNNAPMPDSEFFVRALSRARRSRRPAEGWSREDVQLYLYRAGPRTGSGVRRQHFGWGHDVPVAAQHRRSRRHGADDEPAREHPCHGGRRPRQALLCHPLVGQHLPQRDRPCRCLVPPRQLISRRIP